MASVQAEAVKDRLREFSAGLDPGMGLDEMRASYETFAALTTVPEECRMDGNRRRRCAGDLG